MKDKVSVTKKIFMQQTRELANDPTAGQPNLDGEALWTAVGQTNRNTLDAFIKQGLMPNARGKYWTKRQEHLFSGLCDIEECYDAWIVMLQKKGLSVKPQYSNHIRVLRANLLIWTWVVYGEQYGITLDQVRKILWTNRSRVFLFAQLVFWSLPLLSGRGSSITSWAVASHSSVLARARILFQY